MGFYNAKLCKVERSRPDILGNRSVFVNIFYQNEVVEDSDFLRNIKYLRRPNFFFIFFGSLFKCASILEMHTE